MHLKQKTRVTYPRTLGTKNNISQKEQLQGGGKRRKEKEKRGERREKAWVTRSLPAGAGVQWVQAGTHQRTNQEMIGRALPKRQRIELPL